MAAIDQSGEGQCVIDSQKPIVHNGDTMKNVGWFLVVLAGCFIELLATEELFQEILFSVPDGVRRVKLEVREDASQSWKAHRILHLQGRSSDIRMKIPTQYVENFRVQYSHQDPVKYDVLKGLKIHRNTDDSGTSSGNQFSPTPGFATADRGTDALESESSTADEVIESDIWKVEGNYLYFFNQYRGLQIFDIKDPVQPEQIAYLRMPALGEQMYVLDDLSVVLLLRESRYPDGLVPGDSVDNSNSEIVVVDLGDGKAKVVSKTPLSGTMLETRLVGRKLFAVTNASYPNWWRWPGRLWWEDAVFLEDSGLAEDAEDFFPSYLTTIDLTFPAEPVVVEERGLDSRARVVSAGGSHFLVVRDSGDSWSKDLIDVFSFEGSGIPEFVATVNCGGWIKDKFKMRVREGVLTVVSQAYDDTSSWWSRHTLIENFQLPDDRTPQAQKLDSIQLAKDETLHATRFDQDKLYVVTFRQIDPLFVVDLEDPSNLQVFGELEIPGWSTYLIPRGDRLISVGLEEWQVAVSLFDVSDPAAPDMLSRVYLGEEGEYSYSEANWDEKAVGYLPDQDLILIPYQSASLSAVQSIQIQGDTLEKSAEVSHEIRPRRATVIGDHMISISGEELVVANYQTNDKAEVLARHQLAWPVNKVHLLDGDFLLEEQKGVPSYYWGRKDSVLRIVEKEDPDILLHELTLPEGELLTSTLVNNATRWVGLTRHGDQDDATDTASFAPYYGTAYTTFSIVIVDIAADGSLTLHDPILFSLGDQLEHFYNLDFFNTGEDWLGIWVFGRGIQSASDGTKVETQKLMSRFLALELKQDASAEVLSDVWRVESLANTNSWYYPRSYPPVFAGGRWLFSVKSVGEVNQMDVYDYIDPVRPALIAEPDIPTGLKPVAAFHPTEDGATLLLENIYGYWGPYLYAADARIAPEWNAPAHHQAGYFDGAGLYLFEDTFSELENPTLRWNEDSLFIQENNYSWYYDARVIKPETKPITRYVLNDEWRLEELGRWDFSGESARDFKTEGDHLFAQNGNFLQWVNIQEAGAEPEWSVLPSGVRYRMHLSSAVYEPGAGFWYPVGQYGVEFVEVSTGNVPSPKSIDRSRQSKTTSTWTELPLSEIEVVEEGLGDGPLIAEGEDWAFLFNAVFLEINKIGNAYWHDLGNLGEIFTENYPWVFHKELGWVYVHGEEADLDGFWMWRLTNGHGWLWSSAELYPWCYNAGTQSWWYFVSTADQTLHYDATAQEWVFD